MAKTNDRDERDDWNEVTQNVTLETEALDSEHAMIAAGANLMQRRGAYSTAVSVANPRNIHDVKNRLIQEAKIAGESFYYGWSAKGDRVEGPSIKLALAAARNWGNCAVEPAPIRETKTGWEFMVHMIDLETGFTVGRTFRMSKNFPIHGRMDDFRKEDIRFQIGMSKATRNVIINCLPKWLLDAAMDAAKKGVRDKVEHYVKEKGIVKAVEMILKALAKHGVKEEAVLAKLSYAKREAIGIDDLVILRGDLAAIEDGQEYASTLYPTEAGNDARGKAQQASPTSEVDELLARTEKKQAAEQAAAGGKATEAPETAQNAATAGNEPKPAEAGQHAGGGELEAKAVTTATATGKKGKQTAGTPDAYPWELYVRRAASADDLGAVFADWGHKTRSKGEMDALQRALDDRERALAALEPDQS